MRRRLLGIAAAIALAVAYTVGAKLGLRLATLHPSATPVWPPTGIVLGVFLRWGTHLWPGVFLGAFAANVTTAGTLGTSIGIAAGNTLEGWLGASWVRRLVRGGEVFGHPHDVFRFVLVAAVATVVSATVGVASLALGGLLSSGNAAPVWFTWWMGDLTGALIVTPPILLWGRGGRASWTAVLWVEAAAMLSTAGLVGAVVFGYLSDVGFRQVPVEFLCVPVMLWAAFRFGAAEAATVTLLLSTLAIGGTLRGLGPFARVSPNESLLILQAYMGTLSVVGLAIGSAVEERRRAAAAIVRLNEGLLAAEQNARRMVEEESRRKDEFLAILAHELRTPLNAIVGWTHLVRQGTLDAPSHERAIETLERNALIQARLISNMLDVSRFQSGTLELRREPVDLASVIERAADTVEPVLRRRSVRLHLVLDRSLPPTLGDPDRLQQVIWNLLSNAATFASERGRVEVTLMRAGAWAEVRVVDDGPGIDPAFLPHVFDPFRQRDASTTRRHGGLGLGLAIARHLVEGHGGSIEAANRDDTHGARFTLRLPLGAAAGADAADEGSSGEAPAGPAPVTEEAPASRLAGVRVLVVEDDTDAREFVETLLSGAGARVTTCASAAEAWTSFAATPFDVLVTDIAMPGEDGVALLARVRRSGPAAARGIPAVALTAYAAPSDVAKAAADGFQAHVAKPVDADELLRVVGSFAPNARN